MMVNSYWTHSFLHCCQQRVKLGTSLSEWTTLKGDLPQGTWLGLLFFICFINDLTTFIPAHKFVDDVTLTEIISPNGISKMPDACNEIEQWSAINYMNINPKKSKRMIIGSLSSSIQTILNISRHDIELVFNKFKLLGITISDDLKWFQRISYIIFKVNKVKVSMSR
jgi:hypothetical protein